MIGLLTAIIILLSAACLLIAVQYSARFGLPRGAFSLSESFVISYWLFFFLNGLILWVTGGKDWTSLNLYGQELVPAVLLVMCGLAFFSFGGLCAVGSFKQNVWQTYAPPSSPRPLGRAEMQIMFTVGAILMCVGAFTSIKDYLDTAQANFSFADRNTVLIGISKLLVPGFVFLYYSVRSKVLRLPTRLIGYALLVIGAIAFLPQESRRMGIVALAAVVFLSRVRIVGYIKNTSLRRFALVMAVLVPLMLLFRMFVATKSTGFLAAAGGNVFKYYLSKLWLESSALSAYMVCIKHYGYASFMGGGSFLSAFVFWIPRGIWPGKPDAFDISGILNVNYTIGTSLGGEILANFTVVGIPIFMFIFGFIVKYADIRVLYSRRISFMGRSLYVMALFNMLFLSRGAFQAMAVPLIVCWLVPLVLVSVFKVIPLRPRAPAHGVVDKMNA